MHQNESCRWLKIKILLMGNILKWRYVFGVNYLHFVRFHFDDTSLVFTYFRFQINKTYVLLNFFSPKILFTWFVHSPLFGEHSTVYILHRNLPIMG